MNEPKKLVIWRNLRTDKPRYLIDGSAMSAPLEDVYEYANKAKDDPNATPRDKRDAKLVVALIDWLTLPTK